ncbi:hypothetical protein DFH08DRAFT_800934 [Mycena albidolilacea]|uniref:Uncharacterized protein n=1 Tax=Mycena albidolilacea TaxID=1033008 RepID=A0AAD7AL72_9AGAR|nr:hypothetical protein DFH08DRAFT_800934 [Mycena albidolilacea]
MPSRNSLLSSSNVTMLSTLRARIVEKKLKKKNKWSLIEKGKYTALAKLIARMLHKSGCTQGKVGSVISYITKHAGLEVEGDMSRCTVQCALIEGGVAARVQLWYEIANTDGVTLSSDATSIRGENYEGAHIMINKGSSHKILLGQYSALNFKVHDFLRVWKGGNGDHAPDIKKILLGYNKLQRMEPQKLVDLVCDILQSNLWKVSSEAEWAKLSNNEKNIRTKSSMGTLAFRLGEEVFETLPEETKHEIKLFFWAGCSMHKELNCCKVFDDGMKKFYEEHPELDQPVLLSNKDSDATIQLADDTGESTATVQQALKVSEHGGVKLVSLFGALVNHKDNKKGIHDSYENYFCPTIGASVRFPDMSNTRYQSHRRGGARIIAYLKEHHDFMDIIKDNKQKRTLNHLEQNIVKGIHCPQTISQIVALVLFCMAVMHPYALHVHGPGTENLNMLDLGPYHSSGEGAHEELITNLIPLFSPSTDSYKIAMLDGQLWSNTKAWAACIELFPTLPHVQPLMLVGLKSDTEKAEKVQKEKERLAAIGAEADCREIVKMTDTKLKDQLELHRQAADNEVTLKLKLKVKADRLAALLAALDHSEARIATLASVSSINPPS